MSRRANTLLREQIEAELESICGAIRVNNREAESLRIELERLLQQKAELQSQLIEVLKNSRRKSKPVNGGDE